MVILGWILVALGIFFVVVGLLLGALEEFKRIVAQSVIPIPIPGLGALIGALIKTAWGRIAATGLVLLIIGLAILGAHVTTT